MFALKAKTITASDLKLLLRLLHPYVPDLPLDPRTLRRTPRDCIKVTLRNGVYVHIGLRTSILSLLNSYQVDITVPWTLQLNIDGLRVHDYPGTEMWPILGRITKPIISQPFVIGSFSGRGKPEPLDHFLQAFIDEMEDALKNGVLVNESVTIKITLQSVICDSVARAYVRQVKSHSGYWGCDKCSQKGQRLMNHRMVFPSLNDCRRSDATFRSRSNRPHHIGTSPFEKLPIDMVLDFPLDPMHLIYLGVVKRLLGLWRTADRSSLVRISGSQLKQIDLRLLAAVPSLTVDFPRKCSSIFNHERWKATECRQFLLYLGPVVLRHVLQPRVYENFMVLSSIVYVLSHNTYSRSMLSLIRLLANRFILQFRKLYGDNNVVYNIHCLAHICDDVHRFGALNNFSAFPFESFMKSVKTDINGPKCPAVQLRNRAEERARGGYMHGEIKFMDDTQTESSQSVSSLFLKLNNNFYVSPNQPENCVLYNNHPFLISAVDDKLVHARKFLQLRPLYEHAFSSSSLFIFVASALSVNTTPIPVEYVSAKCLCFTENEEFVIIPILHTFVNP